MDDIHLALFPRAEASLNACKVFSQPWSEVSKQLSEFLYVKEKLETPLLLPVRFVEGATGKVKSAIRDIWLATLDVDGVEKSQYEALAEWLRSKGYNAVIYTTWRHIDAVRGIGKKGEAVDPTYRVRVVLPLSRSVLAVEWKYFWLAYNQYFHGLADESCKDPSRGYFVPSIPKKYQGKEEEKLAFSEVLDGGKCVDVDWLLDSYKREIQEDRGVEHLPDQDSAHSVDKSLVSSLARRLKNMTKRSDLQVIGSKMLQGLRGEIFEDEGNRDNMLFKIAKELASTYPNGKAEDLARPFDAALGAMAEDSGDTFDKGWLRDKLLRAQASELAEIASIKREKDAIEIDAARKEAKQTAQVVEITEESVEAHLESNKLNEDVDDLKKILSHQSAYYVFNGDGYSGPYTSNNCIPACKKLLELQAKKIGFSLDDIISKDDGPSIRKPRSRERLMDLYGTVVDDILYNLEGKSFYDQKRDMLHVSKVRKFAYEPEHIPEVETWLRLIATTDKTFEKLCTWLAHVPDVKQALAALCIIGHASIGKSAFVEGIAKLFGHAPVDMAVAFDNFNEDMLKCPVVFADEELPRDNRNRVQTEKLRRIISSNTHSINGKNVPRVDLVGNMRCVVAMNNIDNFNFGNARHAKQDVEAIKKRFFVIEVPESQKQACIDAFDYKLFVTDGGVARHILHLAATMPKTKERFGVATDSGGYVALGDESTTQFLDVVREILNNMKLLEAEDRAVPPNKPPSVLILPGGQICVYSPALYEDWEMYAEVKRRPSAKILTTTIGSVSEGARISIGSNANRKKFWILDNEIFFKHVTRSDSEEAASELRRKIDIFHDVDMKTQAYKPTEQDREVREEAVSYFNTLLDDDDDEDEAAE